MGALKIRMQITESDFWADAEECWPEVCRVLREGGAAESDLPGRAEDAFDLSSEESGSGVVETYLIIVAAGLTVQGVTEAVKSVMFKKLNKKHGEGAIEEVGASKVDDKKTPPE